MPEDYDPAEDEDLVPGDTDDKDDGKEGKGQKSGRRRRRRRSSSRAKKNDDRENKKSSQAAKSGQGKGKPKKAKQETKAEKAKKDEDDQGGRKSGRRRRRRRSTAKADKSAAKTAEPEKKTSEKKTSKKKTSKKTQPKKGQPKKADKPKKDDKQKGRSAKGSNDKKKGRSERKDRGDSNGSGPSRRPEELTFDGTPEDVLDLSRELDLSDSDRSQAVTDERKIALFCDLENIALGVRDSSEVKKFDIHLVLERLLEKGKIIVKKAYCDWERYSDYKRAFHESAIEMIDIPQKYYSGKNSADIKMVVDAMDLSYSKEHLDTFVVLSGDSDFSPLVSKLKENNKYVIGVGVKNSSSNLLVNNCDEFIYYEDIWRDSKQAPKLDRLDSKSAEAFQLMVDSIQALVRENKDVLWGSMIKQTMQRKKPSFNEGYYGYSSFSDLLEDAQKNNIVKLKKDKRSGSYIVTGFA